MRASARARTGSKKRSPVSENGKKVTVPRGIERIHAAGTLKNVRDHDKKSMVRNGISAGKQFRNYTKTKIKVFTFLDKYYMLLSYYTFILLLTNHFTDCILTLKTRKNQTSELKIPSPGGVRIEVHANKSQGVLKK